MTGTTRARSAVAAIVGVTFIIWMGSRATAIALPLVALDQTGDAWTTGLVLGAQSLPLVTVGWWGARLRDRVTTGPAVAAVMAVKVAGLAIVPAAAAFHRVGVPTLVGCGLVVGATSALDAPGVRSLLSDLGDDLGPGHAARALTLQDLAHRCTMFIAPPLGALAVGHGHTMTLLWSECAAVAAGAVLMTLLPAHASTDAPGPEKGRAQTDDAVAHVGGQVDGQVQVPLDERDASPVQADDQSHPLPGHEPGHGRGHAQGRPVSLWSVMVLHPRVAASMTVHSVVSLTWFAFSLGLAIAGAQTHRPGELIAAGMSGYGLASTMTSFAAPVLVNRLPPWPTAVLPAIALGVAFIALPAHLDSLTAITGLAAAGGLTMPLGIGAHNRLLATDPAPGPERRAAFAADQVADGGAAAIGMLAGGAVIGVIGVPTTLLSAGALQIAAALLAIAARNRTVEQSPRPSPAA